jgi:hypothetical protein
LYLDAGAIVEDMKDAAVVSIEIAVKILPGSIEFDFSSYHLICA